MTSTCPPAQLFGEEVTEAEADGLGPVGLSVGAVDEGAEGAPDADLDAPVDGVAEPPPDAPPDEPPHATRTTTPVITHAPAHPRIRAPPGPASMPTSMPHRGSGAGGDMGTASRTRNGDVDARDAHAPPIAAMLETMECRLGPEQGCEAVTG
ncbi:hypothetical protein ACFZB4_07665 [Streptomyces pseudovenezuelae]|uniref:hypothetical protein n=1 Tax=Streptomyces pseudovenezuelae TaxID=67350 RepID=UPI0036EC8485